MSSPNAAAAETPALHGPEVRYQVLPPLLLETPPAHSTSGAAGFVFPRSGPGAAQGLTVSQGAGLIDPDYRGQTIVSLLNASGEERRIRRGERTARLVFLPFAQARLIQAEELSATRRGAGGFGHTGTL